MRLYNSLITARLALYLGGLLSICAAPLSAQNAPRLPGAVEAVLRAHPSVAPMRVDTPPKIDGQLDDPVWSSAVKITKFVQQRPVESSAPSEETEVYLAYDSRQLYVGIHAHYADTSMIRANRADRDQISSDDTVTVFFDPFLDQQRGYAFAVNGFGVQSDSLLSGSGSGGFGGPGGGGSGGGGGPGGGGNRRGPGDPTWDALFRSAGSLVDDGWTAEMAIPFKSLRYPAHGDGRPHRWGFQIQRDIQGRNESDVWSPVSRDVLGFLAQMGTIEGMQQLSTSRNLEFLPTVTGVDASATDATTGVYGKSTVKEAGVGIKYGITSNLTLDLTFNPDFSQIESDTPQVVVNQRFPLFFPELRPFFLEGQEIFNISGPVTLVHTRTIVDPRYGAKVTGKVGKTTVGFLVADDEAPGKVSAGDPAYGRSVRNVFGRVRYDLYPESHIGLIVTDREFMDQHSRVGGMDSQLRIGRNQRITLRAIGTNNRDAAGVDRSGHMLDASFRKEGRGLSYFASYFQISPDFRTDSGFVRRVNERLANGNLFYRWWPRNWIVNWGPRFNYKRGHAFSGVLQDQGVGLGWNAQFNKNIQVFFNTDRDMERFNAVDFHKVRYAIGTGVNTSRKLSFGGFTNWGDQIRYVTDPYLGTGRNANVTMTVRPQSRLQTELNLASSNFTDVRTNTKEFAIHIYRLLTTYQFTKRLLLRNIANYNDYDRTVGGNLLLTYRVNAGTAFYLGYDDRYREADHINSALYSSADYTRTNRAVFVKLQYLFRS